MRLLRIDSSPRRSRCMGHNHWRPDHKQIQSVPSDSTNHSIVPTTLLFLIFTMATVAPAAAVDATSAPALAFARYIASVQERSPFTESGPVAVEIDASLPGMGKRGRMLAIRQMGASEHNEYHILEIEGDSTVKHQVIARYLAAQEQAETLSNSSVAVTPANYKFRYVGSIGTDGTAVYVFQITPKRKRDGLIKGRIWIDSTTGVAVRQAGRFVTRPSVFIRRMEVARETSLRDGLPCSRVTQVAIETRLLGRVELTITERPVGIADREAAQQLITQRAAP
jgi:hypothetical protein